MALKGKCSNPNWELVYPWYPKLWMALFDHVRIFLLFELFNLNTEQAPNEFTFNVHNSGLQR